MFKKNNISKNNITDDVSNTINEHSALIDNEKKNIIEVRNDINDLISRINDISNLQLRKLEEINFDEINFDIDTLIKQEYHNNLKKFPALDSTDIIVVSVASFVSILFDVLLVGHPTITNSKKSTTIINNSPLTNINRKLTSNMIRKNAEKLGEYFKVPYDISIHKDGLTPNNHRLKSLSHDPLFGIITVIFDIVFNTTTFVDNTGSLKIILNTNNNENYPNAFQSIYYYLGHLVSDLFTTRGIPVPGFFLTQFFTDSSKDISLAKRAEKMYQDGYDLRHLLSMSTSSFIRHIIIESYLNLSSNNIESIPQPFSMKQVTEINEVLLKEKMLFISDSISLSANVLKSCFTSGRVFSNASNYTDYIHFVKSSINMIKASTREYHSELIIATRKEINKNWEMLLTDAEHL